MDEFSLILESYGAFHLRSSLSSSSYLVFHQQFFPKGLKPSRKEKKEGLWREMLHLRYTRNILEEEIYPSYATNPNKYISSSFTHEFPPPSLAPSAFIPWIWSNEVFSDWIAGYLGYVLQTFAKLDSFGKKLKIYSIPSYLNIGTISHTNPV